MPKAIALDLNNLEIKRGDIVKIMKQPDIDHSWLNVGNTLRVSYWADRTLGKTPYICVFLESKKGGRLCSFGVQDNRLAVIEREGVAI